METKEKEKKQQIAHSEDSLEKLLPKLSALIAAFTRSRHCCCIFTPTAFHYADMQIQGRVVIRPPVVSFCIQII
jgi:hypothetical protein